VCEVFEWDAYVTLRFRRVRGTLDQITSGQLYGVLIVTGNGADIFSDWTCDDTREDASSDNATPGTFFAAMWAFVDADEGREV
jgi:hypothetical protein